jgi:two-component system LytT family response regulator
MAIDVLIVDDEPLARDALRSLLSEEPDVTIVGESASGRDAVHAVRTLQPDVMFLDIGLPDMDGFEVVERIEPARRPAVVFVTAHSDRALKAFEVRALDYVTKPLRPARVREAVARLRDRLESRPVPASSAAAPRPPLAVKVDGRLRLVDQRTIDWITADDDHVVIHTGGQSIRTREPLHQVERRLDPTLFVRIHRSTIVCLASIRELQPWFHGDYVAVMAGGAKLRLSRNYRDRVARILGREP